MDVEGEGKRAPKPASVSLTTGDMRSLFVMADRRNSYRAYGNRRGHWKRGMLNGEHLDRIGFVPQSMMPILSGLVGEYGVARYLSPRIGIQLLVDDRLIIDGDGGVDLNPLGLRLDVKTRRKGSKNLVRRVNEHKQLVPMKSDCFVFCKWSTTYEVWLLGWQWTKYIRERLHQLEKSRFGHSNHVIEDRELKPMSSLVSEIQGRAVFRV